MEHVEAVNVGATERYLLGELSEQECAGFEEHFFACPECAADVRAAAAIVHGAPVVLANGAGRHTVSRGPALLDRVRAARDSLFGRQAGGAAARGPRPFGWFWPMPLGAAATLALAVGGLGWQSFVALPSARRELARATAPQPASWAFLSVSRSEQQVVTVGRDDRWLGLTLSRSSSESFPYYRCRLGRDGAARLEWTVPAPERGGEVQTALPLARMTPGRYALAIDGLAGPAGPARTPDVARYEFSLRYRGE